MRTTGLSTSARVGLMLLLALFGTVAFAQNTNTGEIKGTVTDNSGAVLRWRTALPE
jgi:hypothetical protein